MTLQLGEACLELRGDLAQARGNFGRLVGGRLEQQAHQLVAHHGHVFGHACNGQRDGELVIGVGHGPR